MTVGLHLKPGSIFAGDYRVVRRLGGGGMGSIYVVEQLSTGALRALKLMLPHLVDDEEARQRFEREAKVGARIPSDHVVQVIAAGVDEATGAPWLAMEFVDGESLTALVRRAGPLSWADAAELFSQLGHALGAAHEAFIVHRDLKPDNLHVGSSRRPGSPFSLKVLDFGIAKIVAEAGTATATAPIGTLSWMAPEQSELGQVVTPATDVWSIGLVAFWTLTGKNYWLAANDESGSAPAFVRELVIDPLVNASERARKFSAVELPPGFDAWFDKCVVRPPADRFQEGGEACAELSKLLRAAAIDKPAAATTSPKASAAPQAPAPPVAPPRSKKRLGIVFALGATVFGGALALVLSTMHVLPSSSATAPTIASSSAPPAAAPSPTAVTALPPPACQNAKALALYTASLQAMRDANWDHATERLHEAVALEPSCAGIQLRMAMAADDPKESRASLARAVEGRAQLSPRDATLLDAFEPGLRDPRDNDLVAERARAAVKRFPDDAEFFELLSAYSADNEEAVRAARRATELDPGYADAWHDLATHLERLDKDEEARAALERCVAVSPTTADCRSRRARFYAEMGKCEEAEKDLRQAIASTPNSVDLRGQWVEILKNLRRPREAILEALKQKWALMPETERAKRKAFDLLWFDSDSEPMAAVKARIAKAEQLVAASPEAGDHARLVQAQVLVLRAQGKDREAAKVADDYLKRRESWNGASDQTWLEMLVQYTLFKGGAISHAELETARSKWIERAKHQNPPLEPWDIWRIAYHPAFGESAENEAALAAKPPGEPKALWDAAQLGLTYEFTGHHAEAVPVLKRALASCGIRGNYYQAPFGLALDATGDESGACTAYAAFLTIKGIWAPTELTKLVQTRTKALGCDKKK